jgi:ABC-type nitrate/sulfonate/bicarbonate transport system substrate-binding protein
MKNNVVLFWFFGFSWLLTTGSVAQVHDEKVSVSSVVTLQLKWQHAFQFAGYYAAEAQGFYREVGLDVRFSEGKPGVDAVQEVISGRADFGVGTTELLLNRQQGAPITILGVVYQHSPLQLAVLEEALKTRMI